MDKQGVSPVIATILMVAITVMLAATLLWIVGGFAQGIERPNFESSPGGSPENHHTTPPTNNSTPTQPPGESPSKEGRWSVEPLAGYECEYRTIGQRDYWCVPLQTQGD